MRPQTLGDERSTRWTAWRGRSCDQPQREAKQQYQHWRRDRCSRLPLVLVLSSVLSSPPPSSPRPRPKDATSKAAQRGEALCMFQRARAVHNAVESRSFDGARPGVIQRAGLRRLQRTCCQRQISVHPCSAPSNQPSHLKTLPARSWRAVPSSFSTLHVCSPHLRAFSAEAAPCRHRALFFT